MATINTRQAIILVFLCTAYYNFIELNVLVLNTFKRPKGLYFWSFLVSTWGIAFNATGYLLMHLKLTENAHLFATLILIGWCTMITGQSVVLYSRLHLVMHNKTKLRAVLIMIIVNALWLHIPVIVLVYGANSNNPKPYEKPYSVYEKIQLSVFFVQELIISGLYVWETTRLLKLERTLRNSGTVKVMNHLIFVNLLVILLDFTILGLEFANLFDIQTGWKPLVYSIKLKLEFSILNRLVELTRNARTGSAYSHSRTGPHTEGGMALGTLKGTTANRRSMAPNADQNTQYEVHVGSGKDDVDALKPQDSSVVKTTEFHISSHSRRRGSMVSQSESGKEILAESSATADSPAAGRESMSSSEIRFARYHENQPWQ